MVYLLTAAECPPPMVHSGLLDPADDPVTLVTYEAVASGQTSGVARAINQNNRRNENLGRYGGGAYGVAEGRGLSAGDDLNCLVGAGVTIIDGPQVFAEADGLAITDNLYNALDLSVRAHVWQSRSGDLSLRTDLSQPGSASAYLGSVRTDGGAFVDFDRSGVLLLRGGGLYRRTADAGAPADTPDARLQLVTQTKGGLYLWTGTEHRPLQDDAAPVLSAAAEAGNARQVTIQLKNSYGEALSLRRLLRIWIGDASFGGEAAAAPDGGVTVDTGTLLQTVTAGKQFVVLTNASGQVQLTLTESTAKTFYVMAELAGQVNSLSVAFV